MQPSTDIFMMATYAGAGWKNVIIDLEHGPHGERDVIGALGELSRRGMNLHLKLADLDPSKIARFYDFGVRHFMLPHTETAASIRAISETLSVRPGFDPARTHLCPMIESQNALRAIDAICDEAGVSTVHIGAIDLARDMGFTFSTVQQLIEITPDIMPRILAALDEIRAHGKLNGCLLIAEWRDHLPLSRLDYAAVEIGQLISRRDMPPFANAQTLSVETPA